MSVYEITKMNFNDEFNRAISCMESRDGNRYDEFCSICKSMMSYIPEANDYSELLLLFWGFLVTSQKIGYSSFSRKAAQVGFSAINELMRQRNPDGIKDVTIFARDNLFDIYLEDRNLYYIMADEFYKCVLGKYPSIYKDGYRNIKNIINGLSDNGYMDMDYIFITAWCANYGITSIKKGVEIDCDDYRMYKTFVDMYNIFTSFANQKYGYYRYNVPKEIKLYKMSISKPRSYNKNSEDTFKTRPIWPAMAYATAEASGEYYGRFKIANTLGYGNVCDPMKPKEKSIIDERNRKKIRMIIELILIGLGVMGAGFYFYLHPSGFTSVSSALIVIAILAFLFKEVPIWYVGHTYTGPALWFGEHW